MTFDMPLLLSPNTPIKDSFSLTVKFSKFDITGSTDLRHLGLPEMDSPPPKISSSHFHEDSEVGLFYTIPPNFPTYSLNPNANKRPSVVSAIV